MVMVMTNTDGEILTNTDGEIFFGKMLEQGKGQASRVSVNRAPTKIDNVIIALYLLQRRQ